MTTLDVGGQALQSLDLWSLATLILFCNTLIGNNIRVSYPNFGFLHHMLDVKPRVSTECSESQSSHLSNGYHISTCLMGYAWDHAPKWGRSPGNQEAGGEICLVACQPFLPLLTSHSEWVRTCPRVGWRRGLSLSGPHFRYGQGKVNWPLTTVQWGLKFLSPPGWIQTSASHSSTSLFLPFFSPCSWTRHIFSSFQRSSSLKPQLWVPTLETCIDTGKTWVA